MASSTSSTAAIPVIDSHIHLYPESELDSLAWCDKDHPLAKQFSVEEYRKAGATPSLPASSSADSTPKKHLRGFIFVETDRKNGGGDDWSAPLAEVRWLRRIIEGEPKPGEGHVEDDADLCLAAIPWAPLHAGPEAVERYVREARDAAGPDAWPRIRGFRYLLQDKPAGTMLTDAFIGSLKLLGRRRMVFELGVDQHRRGRAQLEEAVEMIDRAHEGVDEAEKVVVIVNHLLKPDLTIINTTTDPSFITWRTTMFTLSKCSSVYMKLSGLFSEMPESLKIRSADDIFAAIYPWLAIVLAAFGSSRIMFGSDWPVCTVGVGGAAWDKWRKVVERMCYMATLEDEDQRMLWGGTAMKAYGIELDDDDDDE